MTISEEKLRGLFLGQFARLSEQAGTYVGRMCRRDREMVLDAAWQMALDLRDEYKPHKITVLQFWDGCLKAVVTAKSYWNLRQFDRWELIASKTIGTVIEIPK